MPYIHQLHDWPDFRWNPEAVLAPLGTVRHLQGKLLGKMSALGFVLRKEAAGGRSTSYELVAETK